MNIKVINTLGNEVGEMEIADSVFNVEYNESLIHQVIVAQLANKRQGTKSTLTRTEVRGGGIKPWRQKGTGRARQGSIRAPQWIKGGVVFAPKPRDFSKKINKRMKETALLSAISQKIRMGEFLVVDNFAVAEAKTKNVVAILKALGVERKAMLIMDNGDENVIRASRNIPTLTTANVALINVYDIVRNGKLIITEEAVKMLEEVYA